MFEVRVHTHFGAVNVDHTTASYFLRADLRCQSSFQFDNGFGFAAPLSASVFPLNQVRSTPKENIALFSRLQTPLRNHSLRLELTHILVPLMLIAPLPSTGRSHTANHASLAAHT